MAKLPQQVESIMAQIDGLLTMIEREKLSLNLFDDLSISMSPIAILLKLVHHLGVTLDEIVEWLSELLVVSTPVIEIAVKGVLLAQLKADIDCNLDPRIPKYLREKVGGCTSIPFLNALNTNVERHIIVNDNRINVVKNSDGKDVVMIDGIEYEVTMKSDGKNVVDINGVEYPVYEEQDDLTKTGIDIDLSTIDFNGLLNNSPMSDRSQHMYFGTKNMYTVEGVFNDEGGLKTYVNYEEIVKKCLKEGIDTKLIQKKSEIDSVYELVRAKDMNAFLWFIINKAKFLNTVDINNVIQESLGDTSILGVITGTTDVSKSDNMVSLGGCYTQTIGGNESSVMGLCIKNTPIQGINGEFKENSTPNTTSTVVSSINVGHQIQKINDNIIGYEYTIVPTTNIWNGCNWYVNRSLYFDFWDVKERDYNKEFALFRLAIKDQDGVSTNKLHFTIKPAPNVIIPQFNVDVSTTKTEKDEKIKISYEGSTPWNFRRIVFNSEGQADFWGKYSVVISNKGPEREGKNNIYELLNPNTEEKIEGIKLSVNILTCSYKLITSGCEDIRMALYECYPGFTVYEFNYDFIMGMRLFDPTVITAELVASLTNLRLGLDYSKTTTDYKMRVSEVVKKILETNGYESSDCFFSFSNETFNRMEEESELKRSQLYPFQDESNRGLKVNDNDVYLILNDYSANATLEENISVISRTLTSASATISEEVLPEDKYNFDFNFIMKGVEMITSIFVEALLSPKMVLILTINQEIMGKGMPKDLDLEKLLNALMNIIYAMITEIVEMIIKKLLDFVMEKVKQLLAGAIQILLLEKFNYYTSLIRQMIENCAFALPRNPNLSSTLDVVDYADIDPNNRPITNEC